MDNFYSVKMKWISPPEGSQKKIAVHINVNMADKVLLWTLLSKGGADFSVEVRKIKKAQRQANTNLDLDKAKG